MMILVPDGQIGMDWAYPVTEPIYGNREQRFSFHLLDNENSPKGTLTGVTGGTLEWHANAQIKGGGKITVQSASATAIDWTKRRIKIYMYIGVQQYPLGIFIPSVPSEDWDDSNVSLSIELLDRCSILAEDAIASAYSVPEGTNVIERVRTLIESSGENAGAITSSTKTLSKAMTWEAGTTKLTIINDLLDAANYFSLFTDGHGHFTVEPQRAASTRPIMFDFKDDAKSVYVPQFKFDKDTFAVPNKVIAVGQGTGDTEAWVKVATNENPNSPYSYQSRGRWIVDVQRGVEATSEADLQEYATRRLRALSSPQGTITIAHAPLPFLNVNDAVKFRRGPAGMNMRCVVESMQIDLDPTALQRTALQEVVDL